MLSIDNPRIEYSRWLSHSFLPAALRTELLAADEASITDRFWRHLTFGTGGLRGIIGAGTNRMNTLTVARATRGLADYVKAYGGNSVCIAYDTRHMSQEFAETAAEILCAGGIEVYLFASPHPTPMLSFAVREKKAFLGIVITASHNPSEYNGYKVYGADGGQITDAAANAISGYIDRYDVLDEPPRLRLAEARVKGLIYDLDEVDTAYYEKVKSLVIRKQMVADKAHELKILYTPLHGTGNIPVRRTLKELGFTNLFVVSEQEAPDEDFPTLKYPNPEETSAFDLARQYAKNLQPDLIFATDPDCDRIGVIARDESGALAVLSGNQVGALLCDYLITAKKETKTLGEKPAIIKTIVTTELARTICENNGVTICDTLTGFKYIGEKIGEWENTKQHCFVFGFEESYGYLAGDFVRDKDAIIAATLISEMALHYKLKGMSLMGALEDLYRRYGYADERLISIVLDGQSGTEKITAIMKGLRKNAADMLVSLRITAMEDYLTGVKYDEDAGMETVLTLPKSDVFKVYFTNSWLAVRPSGTEPKIKFYFGANGDDKADVERRLNEIEHLIRSIV